MTGRIGRAARNAERIAREGVFPAPPPSRMTARLSVRTTIDVQGMKEAILGALAPHVFLGKGEPRSTTLPIFSDSLGRVYRQPGGFSPETDDYTFNIGIASMQLHDKAVEVFLDCRFPEGRGLFSGTVVDPIIFEGLEESKKAIGSTIRKLSGVSSVEAISEDLVSPDDSGRMKVENNMGYYGKLAIDVIV